MKPYDDPFGSTEAGTHGWATRSSSTARSSSPSFDEFAAQRELVSSIPPLSLRRYWNYPTDAELAPLLTDTAGQRHSDALPGDKLRPEVWEQQKEHARAHLPPQFAQLVALTRQPFVQTIGDLAVPAMAHGHVALVGEAAFVPRPHTAASADQAL